MYNRNDRPNDRNQPVRPNQRSDKPVQQPKRESKPAVQKIPGIEQSLVGRKVRLTSLDWKTGLTGILRKVEKYLYVIENDKGNVAVLKHSVGTISGIREESAATE